MTASTLDGPWTAAINPPPGLAQAKAQIEQGEEKDPHDHTHAGPPPPTSGSPLSVFVSTTPAELPVTRGAPQLSPIPKTKLPYVTDTENNIFVDVFRRSTRRDDRRCALQRRVAGKLPPDTGRHPAGPR
jgi:hypothetical protein